MRFICPSCETEYDIPDGKVRNALKLRCHVCGCISKMPVVAPNDDEDLLKKAETDSPDSYAEDFIEGDFSSFRPKRKLAEETEPPLPNDFFAPPDSSLPARDTKQNIRATLMLLFVSFILCVSSALIKIYGKAPPPPVGFENVSYYFTEEDYKKFLVISGTLVNKTTDKVSVPMFFVRFFNKANVMLAKQKIPTVLPLIEPESTLPFSLRIERPPSSAERIELSPQNITVAPVKKEQSPSPKQTKENPSATPESRPASGNGE